MSVTRGRFMVALLVIGATLTLPVGAGQKAMVEHEIGALDGGTIDLGELRGKVILIVNTASECGYTPQYEGLQELYERYRDRGLVVVGVPSNDFGAQEPGSAKEIRTFCTKRFGVTFPLAEKSRVVGEDKCPLYRTLTEGTGEGIRGEVRWNFTKFLVDAEGRVVARFEPKVEPLSAELVKQVENLLPAKG